MPNYAYRGLNQSGKSVGGQLVADDERTALAQIKAQGLYPVELRSTRDTRPSHVNTASTPVFARLRIGAGASDGLTVLSRQLANLVAGGLPLMRTFAALTEHTEDSRLRAVLVSMQQDVQSGKSLWESMESHPKFFPPLYVSMVKAGEASGQLSSVLDWLADYLEKEHGRRMQIRSALAYPLLLVVVGSLSILLLVTLVVPKFVTIFEEFEQALPIPTVILLNVSGFVVHWGWAVVCGAVLVALAVSKYSHTQAGRLRIDAWKLRVPVFGKLGTKSAVSRFARTTSTLLRGGVPLLDSMTTVREVLGNEVLARGADQAREGMREGDSFAARLRQTGAFPPLLCHMVGIGEETGDLQNVLNTVANTYDVEVDATVKSVVSLIEPVIIMTIGTAIAFVILAMLLPIFQINLLAG